MSILDLNGQRTLSDAEEYVQLRNTFEQRLQNLVNEYQDAIRESAVAVPDIDAITAQFEKRYAADVEMAGRKGIEMKPDGFTKIAADLRAQADRIQLYNGPITEETLELFGFRKWPDGSWRTEELKVTPTGKDWSIEVTKVLTNRYSMPYILGVMKATGIKHLSPLNPPTQG